MVGPLSQLDANGSGFCSRVKKDRQAASVFAAPGSELLVQIFGRTEDTLLPIQQVISNGRQQYGGLRRELADSSSNTEFEVDSHRSAIQHWREPRDRETS